MHLFLARRAETGRYLLVLITHDSQFQEINSPDNARGRPCAGKSEAKPQQIGFVPDQRGNLQVEVAHGVDPGGSTPEGGGSRGPYLTIG